MDPIIVALALLIIVPIAVIWALSKSAALRGPMPRTNPRKPVGALVTEVIPEEHPKEDDSEREPAGYEIESEPPAPEPPAPLKPPPPS
jgi:hypothetical protein